MTGFAAIEQGLAKRPARTLILQPWVFADDWGGKPLDAICVGLRLMSEQDKQRARAEAETIAISLHPRVGPNWIDAFNDALMRLLCAFGICDPNDVTEPCSLLSMAEDQVRTALTSRGARFIYEALERYEVETSPLAAEASDADVDALGEAIGDGALHRLTGARAALARRFLRYALDELRAEG